MADKVLPIPASVASGIFTGELNQNIYELQKQNCYLLLEFPTTACKTGKKVLWVYPFTWNTKFWDQGRKNLNDKYRHCR